MLFDLSYHDKYNSVSNRLLRFHRAMHRLLWCDVHSINESYGMARTYGYGDYDYEMASVAGDHISWLIRQGLDPLRVLCSRLLVMSTLSDKKNNVNRKFYKSVLKYLFIDFSILNVIRGELYELGYSPTVLKARPVVGCYYGEQKEKEEPERGDRGEKTRGDKWSLFDHGGAIGSEENGGVDVSSFPSDLCFPFQKASVDS